MSILTTGGIINWKKNNTLLEEFQNEISKSQQKVKLTHLTHKYMTAHFPALVQTLQ